MRLASNVVEKCAGGKMSSSPERSMRRGLPTRHCGVVELQVVLNSMEFLFLSSGMVESRYSALRWVRRGAAVARREQ